ncbi:VOC family protein [Vibrio sp. MA40-2]|uniref:VOC family protein n=1 Tax=Vibrio sp. MA40-2 TaxID=3391828 RepID=UPI0039A74C2A
MRTFNHVGIPTTVGHQGEVFSEEMKLYLTDFSESENRIEWLRFAKDSPMPEELKNTAHIAYEVDDLEEAIKGKTILIEPFNSTEKLRIAFIMDDEAPIELMQYL